jgi:hypothetical protein
MRPTKLIDAFKIFLQLPMNVIMDVRVSDFLTVMEADLPQR